MRINKYKILPLLISLILFIIPFFWLKPGEMDLGGDSSRLYFYDPLHYLKNVALYGVDPSGTGSENINYSLIPFVSLLFFLKKVLGSPYVLITLVNSLSLVIAFLSVYWIVVTFLIQDHDGDSRSDVHFAGIVSGLFYILSPMLTPIGWDKALTVHNLIFLNPLLFLLMLKYILSKKLSYLFAALLITFIFAINFSPSPYFFSFYPLAIIYLLLYAWKVKRIVLSSKEIVISGLLFISLHVFHLLPLLINLLNTESSLYSSTFTDAGKFSRGLSYFLSVANTTKVSTNLLSLPQGEVGILRGFEWLWIVFPAILVIGLILGKKTGRRPTGGVLLLFIFFFITLFFVTANITDIGFYFYKSLFYIPGFAMFRNYGGQFSWVFIFFYALLLGHLLFYILSYFNRKGRIIIFLCLMGLIVVSAWPFIRGDMINLVLNKDSEIPVKVPIVMDPSYEDALGYIRNDPIDGKFLSLPLTDPGWQILAGAQGGAYQGPPTISYLAGKRDFAGYDSLSPFSEHFLKIVKREDYPRLENLLALLNIRYIFYNSDPSIYDDTFPGFPYNQVKNFLPKNQQSYKEFLEQLPIYKIKDFGDKYHIYSIRDDLYLPHIFVASDIVYSTDPLIPYSTLSVEEDLRFVALNLEEAKKGDNIMLKAKSNNPLNYLINNYHLHRHEPFISRKLDDFSYPCVLLREKFELWKVKNNRDQYLDLSLLYMSKRILELDKFREDIPVLKTKWEKPKIWEFYKWRNYNSWEASLARYEKGMGQLIEWLPKSSMPEGWQDASRIKINEQLLQREVGLQGIIKNSNIKEDEKTYLLSLAKRTFAGLFNKLALDIYDPFTIKYSLNIPKNQAGEYEVYLKEEDDIDTDLSKANIEMDGKILKPVEINQRGSLVKLNNVGIKDRKDLVFTLKLNSITLINDSGWQGSGRVRDINGSPVITINNPLGNNSGGLVKEVMGLKPNKQYLVSFEYLTYGDDFIFKFYDKKSTKGQKKVEIASAYFEKNLNSLDWKTHQSILTLDNESVAAFMQIHSNNDKDKSNIVISKISITEIPNPTIIFKKVLPANNNNAVRPKILFAKVNPTKYRVQVEGATSPYTLVFLEQFNGNWELQDVNKDTKNIKGFISRLLGNIGRIVVNVFVKDKPIENNIVASYFNGEVNEGFHRNTFLEPRTFETWGKEAIARERHFQINGYANAWNIEPSDMNGKTDYTLILEMTTQKRFYDTFWLSVLAFIVTLTLFLKTIVRK